MNAVVAITQANLKRLVSDRSNLFFLVVLPLLIVFALGLAIGGSVNEYRIGVVDPHPNGASRAVTDRMDSLPHVTLVQVDDAGALRDDVARRSLDAGWVVAEGETGTDFRWYADASGSGVQLRTLFGSAVEEAGIRQRVEAVVVERTGADPAAVADAVTAAADSVPATSVTVRQLGDGGDTVAGIRSVLAAGELTLFIFLTSLTGAAFLLSTRQLGVTRRMRAAPVPVATIIAGEALARFLVAMLQAAIVVFGSIAIFGVDWRSPGTVALLCVAMSLVGTGAAMLLGTLGRSEQQVVSLGLLLSLTLAALGGSMQPLEFFPDTLRKVAFATPHAWMNDAMWRILVDGDGLAQVWRSVAVLVAAGVALLGVASWAMARTLR